jgi:ABC-type cobalamin/Fe3+-siderophores transport system ATPase subunit
MSSIDFEIVNKTICLCARRASGKSVLLKYIINKNKHKFDTMCARRKKLQNFTMTPLSLRMFLKVIATIGLNN